MRRFRFVGDPKEYGKTTIRVNQVYYEDFIPWTETGKFDVFFGSDKNVLKAFIDFPQDWHEVFDSPKPLHKDTDLGAFSAMFVASGMKVDASIELAKVLITQLDSESGNNTTPH